MGDGVSGVSRSVCTGTVEWARLPISRCKGKEVWPRGRVLCMSRIARYMSSDYLMSGRDSCFCLTIVAGPVGGRTNVFETLCAGKLLVGTCH